jgi:GH24 family phage-related lysozyme (muramidase)
VAFQYGDLASRTPNFWRQVVAHDWSAACANLANFGDRYPTRRKQEAQLLGSLL